jgi:hypothetical protein
MKTIYIAGPMRGKPRFNFDSFAGAAQSLRHHGWEVLSPAEADIDNGFDPDNPGEITAERYESWMRRDFDMIKRSDSIFLLRGWQESEGARRELAFALALGLSILLQE